CIHCGPIGALLLCITDVVTPEVQMRSSHSRAQQRVSASHITSSIATLLFFSTFAGVLSAQSVRGTVVNASNREPLQDAAVVLVNEKNDSVSRVVRTNVLGQFALYAADAGKYRLSISRIGFKPLLGNSIELHDTEVAIVQLDLASLPSDVGKVVVTEHR